MKEENFAFSSRTGKLPFDHDYINFSTMKSADLSGENILTLENLNQHLLHYFCKINSCSKNDASLEDI
jgi:hypothetical protein